MAENPAYLPHHDYQVLVAIFEEVLKYEQAKVLVFGSRANGDHKPDSDLDLVLRTGNGNKQVIDQLRKTIALSEVQTPVEILDYDEVSPGTLSRIEREGILFWQSQ